MKNLRFRPGTFVEIDDFAGGRKVGLVGKDGVTFWDLMDAQESTPLVIHPVMAPVELGSLIEFVDANALQAATRAVIAFLRQRSDGRVDSDPLYLMRVLWFVSQKAGDAGFTPDDAVLRWALESAQQQQLSAARIHKHAEQFCAA